MRTRNHADQRLTAPIITQLTIAMRDQVEQLAHKERVSVAEIARRAVRQYVEQQHQQKRAS